VQVKCQIKQLKNAYEIVSDPFNRNDYAKLINKLQLEVEDELAIEEAESDDESEVLVNETDANTEAMEQFRKYDESKVGNTEKEDTEQFGG
jgi:predicted lipid-binding transport protein (Tim44 family)